MCFLVLWVVVASPIIGQNLVNPNATAETKSLMLFLREVYGKHILSGQVNEKWLPLIQQKTGEQPAILGLDFDGICPSQGGNNSVDKAIDYVKNKGGIVQYQWHWISPNADGDYYSNAFKLGDALNNPNGNSYKNMIRDMDLVAAQIKKMQDAGVPIIWRPIHEAEGAWFWWGMSGREATIKLYRLFYDRFTNYHKLNNIIWIWNSYGSDKGNWYPGDDVCDIIAWDYETGTSWQQYQTLFGNKGKLFGLAEVGGLPDPNNFSARPWSFFLCWDYMIQDPSEPNQDAYGRKGQNSSSWTQKVYSDAKTINLDDLKRYNVYGRLGLSANAGLDQNVSTTGLTTLVYLDGSGSSAPNSSISSYIWKENNVQIATGVKPMVALTFGKHTITLTVTDANGKTATDEVIIQIKRPNLALNKSTTASTTEANNGNIPSNASDGKLSTRWSSEYADPQWLQVDLGAMYLVDSISLSWEAAYAKTYKVEVSLDRVNWTSVHQTSTGDGGTDAMSLSKTDARYVRITATQRATQWGYSLFEFEVYGNSVITDVKDQEQSSYFSVYPNPTSERLYLNAQVQAWKLSDPSGQVLVQGIAPEVDLASLPNGLYFLSMDYGNGMTKTVKVEKVK